MNAVDPRTPRRFARTPKKLTITLLVASMGGMIEQPGTTVDISTGGLRVRTQEALMPGQILDVLTGRTRTRLAQCRVVWVRSARPNQPIEAGLENL